MPIRIGANPIGWSNDDLQEIGGATSLETCLAEAREAGRDDWLKHFEAMAANLFHLAQGLLPGMTERGFGRIITIGSSGVEQPIPRLALSNGIRSAVIGQSSS